MRALIILSLTFSIALASPVGQVSDDAVTTVVPSIVDDVQHDDATTQVVFSDDVDPVTVVAVTSRARQETEDESDDDDDDVTTAAPVVSTKAPIPPPPRNESTVLSEFNYVSQHNPAVPIVPAVAAVAVTPAPIASVVAETVAPVEENENEDAENEIQDEADATTYKPVRDENQGNASYLENIMSSFQGQARAGCECGKLPFKIPVDEESRINPSPWFAAIVRGNLFAGGRPHCAGTLINNYYVLSTASCMDGLTAHSVQVWLTAHDSFEHHQASFGNVKMSVVEILKHPNYDRRSKDNDIALLKLSAPVDISSTSYFVPACLPGGSFDFAGTTARIIGWSDRREYRMCKADMPILDNKICNRDSRHSGKITDNMLCAGFLTPTRLETCIGDAGGPLVSPNGGRSTLVGVVSWGYEAKNREYSPTVYTRVSEFSEWILHNTRDADWCGI